MALLKLIDAKFYVNSSSIVEVQAAYLTYFAYILLGSLSAVFLSDHELPPAKVRRSAFVLGLLAPSVLLAIANQPVRVSPDRIEQSRPIPQISLLPVSSAFAQGDPSLKMPKAESPEGLRASALEVLLLPKAKLQPSFYDAFKAAIGRAELVDQYMYVVGSTGDKAKAFETAADANAILSGNLVPNAKPLVSRVVRVEGMPTFYVVVGGISSHEDALQFKADATASAARALALSPDFSVAKRIAVLLADAPVVPAKALLVKQ